MYTSANSENISVLPGFHKSLGYTSWFPTTGYTVKYQEYGSDVWVDECTQYRNVKEDGYSVKYKIEANLFTTVSDTIEFHITKAKSVLSVIPVKAKDFYVDDFFWQAIVVTDNVFKCFKKYIKSISNIQKVSSFCKSKPS